MTTYSTSIDVKAPPEQVWAVLFDVERWPEWTASMTRVQRLDDGPLAVGSRAKVKQPRLPSIVWTVTELAPGKSFTWESRSPGALSIARHDIVPDESGHGSTVTLAVEQTGIIGGLVGGLLKGLTRRYVDTEAAGLKRRAESG
jgi:uncharacterized membrane protein